MLICRRVSYLYEDSTLQGLDIIQSRTERKKSMNMIILIDEKKGRKIAKNLNLSVVGFLGILLINFKKEYISKNYIIEIIDKADKLGYRLSNTLKTDFLNNL